ncbi:MAG: helix-turn-helix transcriptional regulator [Clostridiales bacterium]|nr:helix-turn-helix transcriptional regulator [Clostridiales bacterium]
MSEKTYKTMLNWVDQNITNPPTLLEMSRYVGYSPYYCSTKFREYCGMSFKRYLGKRKLMMAAKELTHTKETILTIAVRYGFSSHEAFTRAFCREYGRPPSQFRRESTATLANQDSDRR